MTWAAILARWSLVEADLHEVYGIDLADPALAGRSWRWLRVRIEHLLSTEGRLQRALNPPKQPNRPGGRPHRRHRVDPRYSQ